MSSGVKSPFATQSTLGILEEFRHTLVDALQCSPQVISCAPSAAGGTTGILSRGRRRILRRAEMRLAGDAQPLRRFTRADGPLRLRPCRADTCEHPH